MSLFYFNFLLPIFYSSLKIFSAISGSFNELQTNVKCGQHKRKEFKVDNVSLSRTPALSLSFALALYFFSSSVLIFTFVFIFMYELFGHARK